MNLLESEKSRLMESEWPQFFAALPEYLRIKGAVVRTRVGPWNLCSLYINSSKFDLWIERARE